MKCLLCDHHSNEFYSDVFQCENCELVFKNPKNYLNALEEKERYDCHTNDANEIGYRNFLLKLITPLESELNNQMTHLDFGSGKTPMFKILLADKIEKSYFYDLYFYPDKTVLNSQYDLVTCSEVVEHFKDPMNSWSELLSVVKPNGFLAVMTNFYSDKIDYKTWWYKNDFTHNVFYTNKTMKFLAEKFQMKIYYTDEKSVVIFKR